MKLTDFVVTDALVPALQANERDAAVGELVDALVAVEAAPQALRDTLIEQILKREKHGSTGFGKGVAVPHVKHEKIARMSATIGVSPGGVDFNALDKQPVYAIVLLLSPEGQPEEHLQAMETIFSNLQQDRFRRFLRQADSARDIAELLEETDAGTGAAGSG